MRKLITFVAFLCVFQIAVGSVFRFLLHDGLSLWTSLTITLVKGFWFLCVYLLVLFLAHMGYGRFKVLLRFTAYFQIACEITFFLIFGYVTVVTSGLFTYTLFATAKVLIDSLLYIGAYYAVGISHARRMRRWADEYNINQEVVKF